MTPDHDPKPDGFHIKAPSKEWLKRAEKWEEDVSVIAAGVPDPKPLSADEIAEGRRLQQASIVAGSPDGMLWAKERGEYMLWLEEHHDRLIAAAEREGELRQRLENDGKAFQVMAEGAAALRAELEGAKREIEVLRRYGNKDCTAMADEALGGEGATGPGASP